MLVTHVLGRKLDLTEECRLHAIHRMLHAEWDQLGHWRYEAEFEVFGRRPGQTATAYPQHSLALRPLPRAREMISSAVIPLSSAISKSNWRLHKIGGV